MRGEVTIELRTDNPEARFQIGTELETEPAHFGPLRIASVRDHNGILLLSFEGRNDRNSIEDLRNVLLVAEVEIAEPDIDSGEFHATQIIGCRAVTEEGRELGEVIDVLQLPAQDTLVIDVSGKELLVPFVTKHVPEVDVKARRISVANLEGLL